MNKYDEILKRALNQVQNSQYDYYNNGYYTYSEKKTYTISDIIKSIRSLLEKDKEKYSKIILDQLDEQDIQNYLRSKKIKKLKSK